MTKMELQQVLSKIQYEIRNCSHMIVVDANNNDEIVLTGEVASFYQKQLAQEAVKRVLRQWPTLLVKNDLTVKL